MDDKRQAKPSKKKKHENQLEEVYFHGSKTG